MTVNRDELIAGAAQRGKDSHSRRVLAVLAVATTLAIAATLIGGYLLWQEKQRQAQAGVNLAVQVQHACENPTTAAQLGSICAKAEKVEQTITAGPQGPPGVRGPAGVDGVDGVNGTDGADGRDGLNGKNGRDGLNGQDGKDGAPGPAGPAGPPGADGKDGAPGPAGTDGKDGTDGRGISSISCDGAPLSSFTIYYNDGTSQQVDCTK